MSFRNVTRQRTAAKALRVELSIRLEFQEFKRLII